MNDPTLEPDLEVLAALREEPDTFVSGERLAERLGVSRVSVKTRMDRLREQGFSFEAVRNRGYRLGALPSDLNQLALASELRQRAITVVGEILDECASTNDEAMRRLTDGVPSPLVIVARQQSAGRGRLGRRWHSDDAGTLMLSFGFRPQREPAFMQRFTVWAGLRLAQRLSAISGLDVRAKWPNDLLINGRKLAGILTEARLDADRMRELILGLGLNINSEVDNWPPELVAIATSLARDSGRAFSMNVIAADVIEEILTAFDDYLATDIDAGLQALWSQFSAIQGRAVTLTLHQGTVSGEVVALDPTGSLVLRHPDGSEKAYSVGDVALNRPAGEGSQ